MSTIAPTSTLTSHHRELLAPALVEIDKALDEAQEMNGTFTTDQLAEEAGVEPEHAREFLTELRGTVVYQHIREDPDDWLIRDEAFKKWRRRLGV